MKCEIEDEIRYIVSIWEPYEKDLPEVKREYLNKLRLCLVILEKPPVVQMTRAVISNEVRTSA